MTFLPLEPIPAGIYVTRIFMVEERKSPRDRDHTVLHMRVIYGAENGREFYDAVPRRDGDNDPRHKKEMERFEHIRVQLDEEFKALEGTVCLVRVKTDHLRDIPRTRPAKYYIMPDGLEFA